MGGYATVFIAFLGLLMFSGCGVIMVLRSFKRLL